MHIPLTGILGYGENGELGEIEILKIPPILKILILTKVGGYGSPSSGFPPSRE